MFTGKAEDKKEKGGDKADEKVWRKTVATIDQVELVMMFAYMSLLHISCLSSNDCAGLSTG